MKTNINVQKMVISALLIAIGIIIPTFSPLKVVIEPASFTLASHVTIFIAMMFTPGMASAVALGTTLGFFLGGFPIVIVLRAATHLIFAVAGAWWLQKYPSTLQSRRKTYLFSFIIGILHAVSEVIVVSIFYFGGNMSAGYYDRGFLTSIMLLVGFGSVIHSMVDFGIALSVMKPLSKQHSVETLCVYTANKSN